MDVYIIGGKIYAMISPTDIDVYDLSSHYIGTIKAPCGYIYYRFVDGEKHRKRIESHLLYAHKAV